MTDTSILEARLESGNKDDIPDLNQRRWRRKDASAFWASWRRWRPTRTCRSRSRRTPTPEPRPTFSSRNGSQRHPRPRPGCCSRPGSRVRRKSLWRCLSTTTTRTFLLLPAPAKDVKRTQTGSSTRNKSSRRRLKRFFDNTATELYTLQWRSTKVSSSCHRYLWYLLLLDVYEWKDSKVSYLYRFPRLFESL